MDRWKCSSILTILILVTLNAPGLASDFRLATFQAEVTAPIGHALMGGGIAPASEVIDPLYCKGVVLLGADQLGASTAGDEQKAQAYSNQRAPTQRRPHV